MENFVFYFDIIDCITITPICMNVAEKIQNSHTQTTQKTLDFRLKYKTEKCRYWALHGFCPYGETCAFAHEQIEMRQKATIHTKYKTKLCANFTKNAHCKYGDRCLFLHQKVAPKKQPRDRDRTRSKSPVSNIKQANQIYPKKHRNSLSALIDFGAELYNLSYGRKSSRLSFKKNLAPFSVPLNPQPDELEGKY